MSIGIHLCAVWRIYWVIEGNLTICINWRLNDQVIVLSGDKIVYISVNDEIYTCNPDGSNNKFIRSSTGVPINSINVYKDRILFSKYNPEINYAEYGHEFTVKSCKMDGSGEKPGVSQCFGRKTHKSC